MKINFSYIIILVLIIIIIFQGNCNKPIEPKEIIKTKTEVIYDTIEKQIPVYVPKWTTKIKVKLDTVEIADTVEILGNYFASYVYNDSLINDSLKLWINDSISQNTIQSRQINYNLIYPTKIITNEIYSPKRQLYGGFNIIGNQNSIQYFGPGLIYTTKKNQAYNLGIGLDNKLKPNLNVGIYWKF